MPKRSLNPGNNDKKQIEQLNKAVETMLSRADGKSSEGRQALIHCCGLPPICKRCRAKVSRPD